MQIIHFVLWQMHYQKKNVLSWVENDVTSGVLGLELKDNFGVDQDFPDLPPDDKLVIDVQQDEGKPN